MIQWEIDSDGTGQWVMRNNDGVKVSLPYIPFLTNFRICGHNFDIGPKFRFLTKIWILHPKSH